MKVLSIDIGSSSARIMLVDSEPDYEATELYRVSHSAVQDNYGHYRWDITKLFDSLKGAVDDILKSQKVESIGICSWGVDYGVICENGELLDQPYCYRDERNVVAMDQFLATHDSYECFERTGIYPNAINTMFQLLSDKDNGRYDGRKVKITLTADLFAYWLTGNIFAEASNASSTGLLSKSGVDWDYDFITEIGLDRDIFPPVIMAGERYGEYQGVPVVAVGTHDTASAIYAIGEMDSHTAFVSSGSWLLVGKVLDKPLVNHKVYDMGYTNERVCDNKVSLLANINGLYVIQRVVAESGISYRDIDASMDNAKVLGTLDVDKLMSPDDMIGNIKKMLGVGECDIMDIAKTVYYSLAHRLHTALCDLGDITGAKITDIVLTGGASKAKYMLDTLREMGGYDIHILSSEGAVRGNAMRQVRASK